jgi:hypothetical protein
VAYSDSPQDLAGSLGLIPTDQGANVALLSPFDPVVWDRTSEDEGHLCFAIADSRRLSHGKRPDASRRRCTPPVDDGERDSVALVDSAEA